MRSKLSFPISAIAGTSTISKPNRRMLLTTVFTAIGQSVAATRSAPAGMIRPRIRRATPNFRRGGAHLHSPLLLYGSVTMPLPRDKNQSIGGNRDVDARNLVERFFNKIKQCRRVAIRYGGLTANYLAFIRLASMRLWLRMNESRP